MPTSGAGSMTPCGGKFASSSLFTQPEDYLTDPHTQRPIDVGVERGRGMDDNDYDEIDEDATPRCRRRPRNDAMMMRRRLRETFGIAEFRGHQEEIIDATMRGEDVFVVMRTGGGKSLTYQLPAVMECYHHGDCDGGGLVERSDGRRSGMVTVVISPLVSLIRDQEEQMNGMIPGSALSFTSAMAGGTTEQARRWKMVRDPCGGVALIFVTPERVGQSNRFRGEMEKLHNQGRLGRFVIDEW